MDKKVLYGAGAVVVIAVAAFFLMGKSTQAPMGSEGANQVAGSEEQASLRDLLARGGSQKCTFASDGSTGTVYLGSGKMRGDYVSVAKADNTTIESHTISDGTYMYTWSSQMPQGVKMKLADFEGQAQKPEGQAQNPVGYDQKVKTICGGWTVDGTLFVPPGNVEFMDIGALMGGLGGNLPTAPKVDATAPPTAPGASNQCAMCDQVPDAESKAQCRVALGCK